MSALSPICLIRIAGKRSRKIIILVKKVRPTSQYKLVVTEHVILFSFTLYPNVTLVRHYVPPFPPIFRDIECTQFSTSCYVSLFLNKMKFLNEKKKSSYRVGIENNRCVCSQTLCRWATSVSCILFKTCCRSINVFLLIFRLYFSG